MEEAMKVKFESPTVNMARRKFICTLLPVGGLVCLGCSNLMAGVQEKNPDKNQPGKHKFKMPADITWEQVYTLALRMSIPTLQELLNAIGKEKFLSMLKTASSDAMAGTIKSILDRFPNRDLSTFANLMINNPNFKNTLSFSVVRNTAEVFELKVTECIWARVARSINVPDAAEIGYSAICYPDYITASTFNPKIQMVRDKTLMQGYEICNHRYILQKS